MSTGSLTSGQSGVVTSSVARVAVPPSANVPDVPDDRPHSATIETGARTAPDFDAIYEENFDLVWRTARRLGVPESAAEDAVQDTFLVLHRRLDEYDGRASIKRWLLGILVKVVADHRRRYKRKDAPCVPHAADSDGNVALVSSAPAPSEEIEQAETLALLDTLLAQLDKDKREVLVLAQLEEMSVPEISEVLGVNVNTVYARLRAARREFEAAHARHRARAERDPRRVR